MFKYNFSKGNAQQSSWSPKRYSRTFLSIKLDRSIPLRDGSVHQMVELVGTLQMWNLGIEDRGPHPDYRGSRHRTWGCSGGAESGWLSCLHGIMTPPSHSCPRLLFHVSLNPLSNYHWVKLQPQIRERAWGKGLSCSAQTISSGMSTQPNRAKGALDEMES